MLDGLFRGRLYGGMGGQAEIILRGEIDSARTDARFVFFAGRENRCFLPESQVETFRWFDQHQPGRHAVHELDGYSHLDVFMGKDAARDIFPIMIDELERAA